MLELKLFHEYVIIFKESLKWNAGHFSDIFRYLWRNMKCFSILFCPIIAIRPSPSEKHVRTFSYHQIQFINHFATTATWMPLFFFYCLFFLLTVCTIKKLTTRFRSDGQQWWYLILPGELTFFLWLSYSRVHDFFMKTKQTWEFLYCIKKFLGIVFSEKFIYMIKSSVRTISSFNVITVIVNYRNYHYITLSCSSISWH
jgi:hypothetical protein